MSSDNASKDGSLAWPVSRVRSTFIDYFRNTRGHVFWSSSPVVPVNDPTLLFANAGMNQFKPLFLGTCDPALEMSKLTMAVNSQKCIRAGGKHNDLDDVGKDVYHHTFFEMLGNWSFGSYFKEEAISWAWECLVDVFQINPNRIYATYFGGDPSQGLAVDIEAKEIWERYLPPSRVLPFGCKENFWEMGTTGPCGPCSEIHYDRIGDRDASAFVNADRPDVIEIWNNVFIQFNREADGSLRELPSKHVDTGMGLERLTSVLQHKDSNYDTDIFTPIFDAIQQVSGCRPYQGLVGADDVELKDTAYRVVADHIRTLTFAITDGAVPSNDGRGYVLRRILRRAVRYGQEILGAPGGFFTSLVPVVVNNFSEAFPELLTKKDFVMTVLADEEQSFNRTLDQGVKYFKKVVGTMKASELSTFPAKEAHILFSSMGFPLDLTELMAAEYGYSVDKVGFSDLMENDRKVSEAAEAARKGGPSKDMSMVAEQTSWLQSSGIAITASDSKYSWNTALPANVVAIYTGRGGLSTGFVDATQSSSDAVIGILVDSSSFYYESGGQTFDTGLISTTDGATKFVVENVQAYAGYVLHVGRLLSGELRVGSEVVMSVDYGRRQLIAPNHTMTHVLNFALRSVLLGDISTTSQQGLCEQKGSLVDAEKLRFDFSWSSSLTDEQIVRVEALVNKQIHDALPVSSEVVPLADATQIFGLRQVFGEKYPDPVRVISIGASVHNLLDNPSNTEWSQMSIEFCGGTHLSNTRDAENFVLAEEIGIAKGIRRIVGLTRSAAVAARALAAEILNKLSQLDSVPAGPELSAQAKELKLEIDTAVVSLADKAQMRTQLSLIVDKLKVWYKANLLSRVSDACAKADIIALTARDKGESIIVEQLDLGADGKVAKKIQEAVRTVIPDATVVIVSLDDENERANIYIAVSALHISMGFDAKRCLDQLIADAGNGKGGGKADLANGNISGGQEIADLVVRVGRTYFRV